MPTTLILILAALSGMTNRYKRSDVLIRSFAVSLLFYSFQANAEPVQAWIAGSYVNVRETSLKNAPVLDRLTINTPVMLGAVHK